MIDIREISYKFKKAYVCSPLSADTPEKIRGNMERAKLYVKCAEILLNCKAVAPHAVLPEFLYESQLKSTQTSLLIFLTLLALGATRFHCFNLRFVLDDNNSRERALALSFGLDLLSLCDVIIVFGDYISRGMKSEIQLAKALDIPVIYANVSTFAFLKAGAICE